MKNPKNAIRLCDGLFSKMLLVPYDNTMWLRCEAVPIRADRTSYDFSILFLKIQEKPCSWAQLRLILFGQA